MQFRNDIQGLRAIAFLLVYIFHLNPHWLPGGYIGVDMFFVISGYLITSIILHQKEKGTFRFLDFYEKRIKRIVPAYYVALLFITLAAYYFYLQSDTVQLRSGLYRTFAFISNQFFATGESYFGAKLSENPLLHTWSLAIEMQFYLILPFLLILIKNKWLPYVIGGLLVILTGYSTYGLYYTDNFSAIYFSLLSRIPEFFVGVLLSLLFLKRQVPSKNTSTAISIIGLLTLGATAFLINENTLFPGVLALLPCTAIGLLLVSGENIISRFLSSKPMVYIGELSYSLYLWHWPIMAYLRYQDPVRTTFNWTEILFISLLTFVLAWLSYTFVEQTFRKLNKKRFILSFSPIVALSSFFILFLPRLSLNPPIPTSFIKPVFGLASHGKDSVEVFGDLNANLSNIALIGDSHALGMKPFMNYMGERYNFSYKTLTCNGIPAFGKVDKAEIPKHRLHQWVTSNTLIRTTQKLIKENNIIFVNCIDFHRYPSVARNIRGIAKELRPDQKMVLFITFPIYPSDPLRKNRSITKRIDGEFIESPTTENRELIEGLCEKYDNVYTFDLSESKAFEEGVFYNDTLMYYNHSHINLYGSLTLAKESEKEFATFLKKLFND